MQSLVEFDRYWQRMVELSEVWWSFVGLGRVIGIGGNGRERQGLARFGRGIRKKLDLL